TSPPRPPSPPAGPPSGTYFSRRNALHPSPPAPDWTVSRISSMNTPETPWPPAGDRRPLLRGRLGRRPLHVDRPIRVKLDEAVHGRPQGEVAAALDVLPRMELRADLAHE